MIVGVNVNFRSRPQLHQKNDDRERAKGGETPSGTGRGIGIGGARDPGHKVAVPPSQTDADKGFFGITVL